MPLEGVRKPVFCLFQDIEIGSGIKWTITSSRETGLFRKRPVKTINEIISHNNKLVVNLSMFFMTSFSRSFIKRQTSGTSSDNE